MNPVYPAIALLFFCVQFLPLTSHADVAYTSDDFSHWLDAANIAQASYETQSQLQDTLQRQGYRIDIYRQIEGYSVAYALATNESTRHQLIVVRGTSNIENAIVDAAFVLVADKISGVDIHQGFLLSARDIFEQIHEAIRPGYKVDTIGHSLGGATALILAMMLDARGADIGEVITFGQPKVTNISGARRFRHLKVTRLVTPKDMVPLVPPVDPTDLMDFSIFWHLGTEVVLYEKQRYAVLSGIDSMLRATDFLNDIPDENHLTAHFITTYINRIKPKLIRPERIKYVSDFKLSDWFGKSDTEATKSGNKTQ